MKRTGQKSLHLHKAGHDPRAAALVALSRVLHEGIDSQAALDGVLGSVHLVPTDKRLCTELVYGSLRWYLRLRQFTERFLSKPGKLPDEMRLGLITSLYEMAFLRTPHHAAVGWAVTHVRNRFGKGLASVANGALRSMQRALRDFSAPDIPLSEAYSMPEWIVRLWMDSYGEGEALLLLEASQTAPPSGLRLNRSHAEWEKLRNQLLQGDNEQEKPLVVDPCALSYEGPLPWIARTLIRDGRATRQSAASFEALEAFTPKAWLQPVWDCCAGRGGKTLALLEQKIPVALASDPSKQRIATLPKEYARLGLRNPPCPVINISSAIEDESSGEKRLAAGMDSDNTSIPEKFGTILIDAPCSGLGTLARHPEIRIRRTPEDCNNLARLQSQILDSAWEKLLPGGQLVYLTCTLNPAENERQVARLLEKHTQAALQKEFRTPFTSPLREFFYGAMIEKRLIFADTSINHFSF